jgi:hypothetical protein
MLHKTQLFRKHLEDTISHLQKSYDNYKAEEEKATDEQHKLILNASAAQRFEALSEARNLLDHYNKLHAAPPSFHILNYNYYLITPSQLKLKFNNGDAITIDLLSTAGLSSNEALTKLLIRAEELAEQFNAPENQK